MIIIRPGAVGPKFFSKKSHSTENCAENTLFLILIHALPILIHGLGFRLSAPYLNTCNTYFNTLSRLSAPFPNTCITYLNTLSRLSAPCITYLYTLSRLYTLIHCRLGNQSESSITSHPRLSAANQNRVLRHPSRQPIRIEYYVTRVVITSPESSRLGRRSLLGPRLKSARCSLS